MFLVPWSTVCCNARIAGVSGALHGMVSGGLESLPFFDRATDVDNVVGDDTEPHPPVHSDEALVAAAPEAVAPLTMLMCPSDPVRHFWPSRNQRFLCSHLRSGLLVERLGMQTRLTPFALAAASFLAE
jgi:hypothetical protein